MCKERNKTTYGSTCASVDIAVAMEFHSYEQTARIHHSSSQRGLQNNYCSQVVIFHILSFRKVHVLHNADRAPAFKFCADVN